MLKRPLAFLRFRLSLSTFDSRCTSPLASNRISPVEFPFDIFVPVTSSDQNFQGISQHQNFFDCQIDLFIEKMPFFEVIFFILIYRMFFPAILLTPFLYILQIHILQGLAIYPGTALDTPGRIIYSVIKSLILLYNINYH